MHRHLSRQPSRASSLFQNRIANRGRTGDLARLKSTSLAPVSGGDARPTQDHGDQWNPYGLKPIGLVGG